MFLEGFAAIPKQRTARLHKPLVCLCGAGKLDRRVLVRTKTLHLVESSKSSVTVRRKVFSDTFGTTTFWRSSKLSLGPSLVFSVHEGLMNM